MCNRWKASRCVGSMARANYPSDAGVQMPTGSLSGCGCTRWANNQSAADQGCASGNWDAVPGGTIGASACMAEGKGGEGVTAIAKEGTALTVLGKSNVGSCDKVAAWDCITEARVTVEAVPAPSAPSR